MKQVSVDEHITVEAQAYSIKDNSEFKPEGLSTLALDVKTPSMM